MADQHYELENFLQLSNPLLFIRKIISSTPHDTWYVAWNFGDLVDKSTV